MNTTKKNHKKSLRQKFKRRKKILHYKIKLIRQQVELAAEVIVREEERGVERQLNSYHLNFIVVAAAADGAQRYFDFLL